MRAPEDELFEFNDSKILEQEMEELEDDLVQNTGNEEKERKDRYIGGIDPVTGLRNGHGTYKYSNPYFTYEGEWVDGLKHGNGWLKFADGGYF